ncbi:MAG TPA: COX15/CtaA family protein [Burkholderiales bacterium]
MTARDRRHVAAWLFACAALAFLVVLIGGVTRLTRSGLSIVEWQPLVGALPPLTQADWEALFAKYRETPEFRQVNFSMTLEGFKRIFWWEYIHRLLARLIGVVFLLPYLYFLVRKNLDRPLAWKLGGIFLLGALQGTVGWYMVKSGLVDDPKVSPVRLTMHLGLALAIFSAELWLAMQLLAPKQRFDGFALFLPVIVFLMALSGGMVAGLRAGYAYNTFPLMNGQIVPPEVMLLEPWWRNFVYNMATVQLVHRAFFWALAVLVLVAWWRNRESAAGNALLLTFAVQASLGIATLLTGVPVGLGSAHQGGAVLVLAAALWYAHSTEAARTSGLPAPPARREAE